MKILSFDVGIVNLAYCIIEDSRIKHWEVITLENTPDHAKLYTNLIQNLDKRKHLLENIDVVLIEKQPSFNPKMRIISGCIQTYFYIRGVVDSSNVKKILFYSPKHKLKCQGDYTSLEVTGKSKYQRTKKLGILICRNKLEELDSDWLPLFEKHKKKDDLADSYLQALTYMGTSVEKTIPKQKITKAGVKKLIKDYMDTQKKTEKISVIELLNSKEQNNHSLLDFFNGMDLTLKNLITEKYSFTFPMNIDSLTDLLTEIKCKNYLSIKWF